MSAVTSSAPSVDMSGGNSPLSAVASDVRLADMSVRVESPALSGNPASGPWFASVGGSDEGVHATKQPSRAIWTSERD